MKNKSLSTIVLLALSTSLMASQVDVTSSSTYSSDEQVITVKATMDESSSSIFLPEKQARIKAAQSASNVADNTLASICTNGFVDGARIEHEIDDCSVIDHDKNTVRCTVESKALCNGFGGIKSKAGLRLKLGKVAPSTACVDVVKDQNYSIDNDIVNYCNSITNETQFECVEILTRYSTINTPSIRECGRFLSKQAINVMRFYSGEGEDAQAYTKPNFITVEAFAAVKTDKEEACYINKMKTGSINASDLMSSCLSLKRNVEEEAGGLWNAIKKVLK